MLLPGFFVATQFFFTITMCCVLASAFLSFVYLKKDTDDDIYLTLLVTLGTVLVIGGEYLAFFYVIHTFIALQH